MFDSTRFRRIPAAIALGVLLLRAAVAAASDGRLIDRRTREPIAGAEVAVVGLTGTVRTDRDGRFVLATDPPPPFVLIVLLPGGRLAEPIRIATRDGSAPLVVEVDPARGETLVVIGAAPSIDATPGAPATIVPAAEIARRAPATLVQSLEDVPGVSGVGEGQGVVPAIRGLARGRALVLLDGGRLFSEKRAGASVSFLAPEIADRIDVVRGPASVAYGSDAFGGVISVVTRRPALGPPSGRLTATIGTGVPSRRASAEIASGLGSRGAILIAIRGRKARDYSSPAGVVPNSAWTDRGALARVAANAGGAWTASWQGDSVGEAGLPRSDTATLRVSSRFERSQRTAVSFDRAGVPGIGVLSVSGFVNIYEQRLDQDRAAAPGRPRRLDRADLSGRDLELRAVGRRAFGRSRLTSGLDLTARRGLEAHDIGIAFNGAGLVTTITDNTSIGSANRRAAGVFTQVELPVAARLTVAAGARLDAIRSANIGGFFGDRTISQRAASGSVSAALRVSAPLTIGGQISRGFHDPTLSDRFYRGPSGRGFIVGNPELAPERSRQYDLTARYDAGRWRAGVALYRYDISRLIERYQADADTFLFRNRGRADVRGVEMEAGFSLAGGLLIEVMAQSGRGRARDDGAALDDIAPRSAVVQIRKSIGERVTVSARVAAFARDRAPGPSEAATPGYVDAGATASVRVGRGLELRAAAANLLNRRYLSSPSPRAVLAAGRHGSFSVAVKF
jgi:outer membrane receptor protein involved in Fe transport